MIFKPPVEELYEGSNPLQPIKSATGYFLLGMLPEALEELDRLLPEREDSEEALSLRGSIYFGMEAWTELMKIASVLVKECPEVSQYWIWLGHATRMLHWYAESEAVLNQALVIHQFDPMLYFCLACTAAQQGEMLAARSRLISALALDVNVCFLAMVEPDLQPLWIDLEVERQNSESQ